MGQDKDPSSIDDTLAASGSPGQPLPAPADAHELLPVEESSYVIGAEIARGGMGRIVAARDRRLGRRIALKTMIDGDAEVTARFEREARITARLEHPAIVPVHEAGRLNGRPFYAMKLVAGRSLDKVIAETRTLADRLALLPNAIDVVEAMAYAHSQRVIHRDLKPQNVLVGAFGETVVIDWGLAKDLAEVHDAPVPPAGPFRRAPGDAATTVAGTVMGTPAYMPPEQADGAAVDERADVWSLGAMLYHLLSGAPPYEGRTAAEVLAAVSEGPPPPLETRAAGVPRDLATIVMSAMSRAPSERPTSRELATQLRQFQTGKLVDSHAYTFAELLRRWIARHRAAVGVATVAVAVLAIVAIVSVRRVVASRDRADAARADADRARVHAEDEQRAASALSTELLEDQGRQELLAGHHRRAAVYLAEAYARTPAPEPPLRIMLAAALADMDAERTVMPDAVPALQDGVEPAYGAFARDGRVIVVAGDAGDAVPGMDAGDRCLTSTDHARTVARDEGRRAIVVRDAAGHELRAFPDDLGDGSVCLTGDGARVVRAGAQGRDEPSLVRVWDVATGKLVASTTHTLALEAIPLASGDILLGPYPLALWDPAAPRPLWSFSEALPPGTIVRVAPDDTRLVAGGASELQLLGMNGRGISKLATGPVSDARFSPDGSLLATAGKDGVVRLWDGHTGAARAELEGHAGSVTALRFSADGARLASTGADRSIRVWDVAAVLTWQSLSDEDDVSAVSPDGARLVVEWGGSWEVVDPRGRAITKLDWTPATIETSGGPESAPLSIYGFADQGRLILSYEPSDAAQSVVLWDATTGKIARRLSDGFPCALSPDGSTAIELGDDPDRLLLAKVDGSAPRTIALPKGDRSDAKPEGAAWSTDGAMFALSTERGWLDVVDVRAGTVNISAQVGERGESARFSADGRTVFVPGGIVDVATGHVVPWPRAVDAVLDVSADGRLVLVVSRDSDAPAIEVRDGTGALIASMPTEDPRAAAFSADGHEVVVVGKRGASLWQSETGRELAHLPPGSVAVVTEPQDLLPKDRAAIRHDIVARAGTIFTRFTARAETRSAADVTALVARRAGWMLDRGALVPRPLHP